MIILILNFDKVSVYQTLLFYYFYFLLLIFSLYHELVFLSHAMAFGTPSFKPAPTSTSTSSPSSFVPIFDLESCHVLSSLLAVVDCYYNSVIQCVCCTDRQINRQIDREDEKYTMSSSNQIKKNEKIFYFFPCVILDPCFVKRKKKF